MAWLSRYYMYVSLGHKPLFIESNWRWQQIKLLWTTEAYNKQHLNSTALIFTFVKQFPTFSFMKITVLFTCTLVWVFSQNFDEIFFLSDGSIDMMIKFKSTVATHLACMTWPSFFFAMCLAADCIRQMCHIWKTQAQSLHRGSGQTMNSYFVVYFKYNLTNKQTYCPNKRFWWSYSYGPAKSHFSLSLCPVFTHKKQKKPVSCHKHYIARKPSIKFRTKISVIFVVIQMNKLMNQNILKEEWKQLLESWMLLILNIFSCLPLVSLSVSRNYFHSSQGNQVTIEFVLICIFTTRGIKNTPSKQVLKTLY